MQRIPPYAAYAAPVQPNATHWQPNAPPQMYHISPYATLWLTRQHHMQRFLQYAAYAAPLQPNAKKRLQNAISSKIIGNSRQLFSSKKHVTFEPCRHPVGPPRFFALLPHKKHSPTRCCLVGWWLVGGLAGLAGWAGWAGWLAGRARSAQK